MSSNSEEQADELLALSEILAPGTLAVNQLGPASHSGTIQVSVALGRPVYIVDTAATTEPFQVSFLPPITMEFSLWSEYPSSTMPSVTLSCLWLTADQLQKITHELGSLWEANRGSVILFLWITFLQEDLLSFLDFSYEIDLQSLCANTARSSHVEATETSLSPDTENEGKKLTQDKEIIAENEPVTKLKEDEKGKEVVRFKEDAVRRVKDAGGTKENKKQKIVLNPYAKEWKGKRTQLTSGKRNDAAHVLIGAPEMEQKCKGRVKSFSITDGTGIIVNSQDQTQLLVRQYSIATPNLERLEVSLQAGEEVEFNIQEVAASRGKAGRQWEFEAVNVTGPSGGKVVGSRQSETVRVVETDVTGRVFTWSNRRGEGLLKDSREELKPVYVYYTSLHFYPPHLAINQRVRFNIVECEKWGRLAQYVRLCDEEVPNQNAPHKSPPKQALEGEKKPPRRASEGGKVSHMVDAMKSLVVTDVAENSALTERTSVDASTRLPEVMSEQEDGGREHVGACAENASGQKEAASKKRCGQSDVESKGPRREISRLMRTQLRNLITHLREYNNMKEEEAFAAATFPCLVCFSAKQGASCVKFAGCGHVYCRDCMSQYFRVQIESGQVSSLTCPTAGCNTQAYPAQVQELVSSELFSRYESILLETTLESMTDIILCPRRLCQCPTVIDRDNNMGQCPACQLTFCIYCKATYHGVSPCKFKTQEHRAILDKYNTGTDDEKLFLERRYGKRELQILATNLLSEDYLSANAKHCPHCRAPIEKNEGCNKITCRRCNTNFCWLCGDKLPAANPYSHFNLLGGACYGALFQGVDPMEDDGWIDLQF